MNRISQRINTLIPVSQTAYRAGRSTTENVFAFKILIEKAISMTNSEINILLLDMSKAFDSVHRNVLMEDLKEVLDEDEIHILKVLI